MSVTISASVLSADVCRLDSELDRVKRSGADHIHFDVMDGVFVNNISYGVPVLSGIRKYTDMFIDAHLMIIDPLRYVGVFADSGADMITFHIESESDPAATISAIKGKGKKAGIAVSPNTPVSAVYPYAAAADMILVMTVEPGFGGQGFIPHTVGKIRELREFIVEKGLDTHIQVDGGINAETAKLVRNAGADILVAGSYLFKAEDMSAAVSAMRGS